MQAVEFINTGGPEAMRLVEVDRPTPGPGEALVKMGASGLNYSDLMIRNGTYPGEVKFPYRVGREIAGTVEQLGDSVGNLRVGQRVSGIVPAGGSMAEYAIAPAPALFPTPDTIPDAVAAAIPVQGAAAMLTMGSLANVQAGEDVLIHSAAGGVGGLATQIAVAMGANVVGTTSRDDKLTAITQLGATAVNYTNSDWTDQVLAATDGNGADVVLESLGGQFFTDSWQKASALDARIVTIGAAYGPVSVDTTDILVLHRTLMGFNIGSYFPERGNLVAAALNELANLVQNGEVTIRISHQVPLADAADAFAAMEERQNLGKVVVTP